MLLSPRRLLQVSDPPCLDQPAMPGRLSPHQAPPLQRLFQLQPPSQFHFYRLYLMIKEMLLAGETLVNLDFLSKYWDVVAPDPVLAVDREWY